LHDRLKAEAWRVAQLGDKPKYTWKDAVVKWLTDMSHKKSIQTDKEILRYLNQHLQDKQLDEINKSCIDAIKSHKLSTGASNATVNRMLALIRAVLNAAAKDWEWLDDAPRVKMMPTVKSRIRWITKQEANRLFHELPEHLEAMARFSLATGLRESNVTGLEWTQIDMQRRCAWIYADQAKAGKSISVPLNEDAMIVLRKQMGKHKTHVFAYKGNPIGIANTKAWRNALKRAGISDFRWHDLRHTWASWHVQSGTPLHVLKELGGWADLTMVLRYAHLSSDHLNGYAANIENRKFDTNSTQTQKNPESENRYRA
jgi:integrase